MCLLLLNDTSVGFADGWSCAADHACCDNCIQCIIQDSGSSICHTSQFFYEAYEVKKLTLLIESLLDEFTNNRQIIFLF